MYAYIYECTEILKISFIASWYGDIRRPFLHRAVCTHVRVFWRLRTNRHCSVGGGTFDWWDSCSFGSCLQRGTPWVHCFACGHVQDASRRSLAQVIVWATCEHSFQTITNASQKQALLAVARATFPTSIASPRGQSTIIDGNHLRPRRADSRILIYFKIS